MPIAEPKVAIIKTNKVRDTRFRHQPLSVAVSSRSFEKSATLGLRKNISTAAATKPAPMVGLSEVKGAATKAVKTVSGCPPAINTPKALSPPLISTQSRTI